MLDIELSESLARQDADTPKEEKRANHAAAEFLVPGPEWRNSSPTPDPSTQTRELRSLPKESVFILVSL